MYKCPTCEKETEKLFYTTIYPHLITKNQQDRGVLPRGDVLMKTCLDCSKKVNFYNPEIFDLN